MTVCGSLVVGVLAFGGADKSIGGDISLARVLFGKVCRH